MKVSELRVGNWVLRNGEYVEIHNICSSTSVNFLDCDIHDPIPLTEEILLKCGFTHMMRNRIKVYTNFKSFEFIKTTKGFMSVSSGRLDIVGIKPIKHLHQLQNLYYALTGEELKIEL